MEKVALTVDELLVVANEIYTHFFWEIYLKTGRISVARMAAEKARNAYLDDEHYELTEEILTPNQEGRKL